MFSCCKLTTNFKFLSQWAAANSCLDEVWGMERFFPMFLLHSHLSAGSAHLCHALVSPVGVEGYCLLLSAKLIAVTRRFVSPVAQPWSYTLRIWASGVEHFLCCCSSPPHKLFLLPMEALGQKLISCPSLSDGRFLPCIHAGS